MQYTQYIILETLSEADIYSICALYLNFFETYHFNVRNNKILIPQIKFRLSSRENLSGITSCY